VHAVLGLRRSADPDGLDPTPRLDAVGELLGEHPPVPRVAHRIDHGAPGGDVVGLVEHPAAERLAEVPGDDDLRTVPAHDGRGLAPERHAVPQHAVGLVQELDDVDADDARRLDLLGLADASALVWVHGVDAGLAGGDHAVDDLLALAGPARDGSRGA